MDWTLAIVMLIIGLTFAGVALIGILGLYFIITIILHRLDQKPAFKTRVRIAMQSCPDYIYGFKLMLTGTARQSKVTIGNIIGFSRMRNEHIANLVRAVSKAPQKKKKELIKVLEKNLKKISGDGARIPPEQFWLNLTEHDSNLLNDLVFLNFAVVIPKVFGPLVWITPLVSFLPKQVILFLDSQIATPNKELFGDIWLKGVNLNMTNGDYWFVDDERLTKYTIAMCIRSDAYVYELVESWNKLSEISKLHTETHMGVIKEIMKFKQPVGATSYGPPSRYPMRPPE